MKSVVTITCIEKQNLTPDHFFEGLWPFKKHLYFRLQYPVEMKWDWVLLYSDKLFILYQQNADGQVGFFSLSSPELRLPDCLVAASLDPVDPRC